MSGYDGNTVEKDTKMPHHHAHVMTRFTSVQMVSAERCFQISAHTSVILFLMTGKEEDSQGSGTETTG